MILFTGFALIAVIGGAGSPVGMVLVAAVVDLLAGWGLLRIVRTMRSSEARLSFDDEGVLDRTLPIGKIPWHTIQAVQSIQSRRSGVVYMSLLRLRLADEDQRFQQLSPKQQKLASVNRSMGYGAFHLNLTALPVSAEFVILLMNERRAQIGLPALIDGIDTALPAGPNHPS